MDAFINLIISLIHFLKYDITVNKNRSFGKELEATTLIVGVESDSLKRVINEQLSSLLVKGNGVPAYAYVKNKKDNWYDIFIINKEKKFYCRLECMEILDIVLPQKGYISLE